MASKQKTVKVTLIKSRHGRKPGHTECLQGLGLRRVNQSVEVVDTPETRGMIDKVGYLVRIEEA
jgi:large subunit ribosomal protein L30